MFNSQRTGSVIVLLADPIAFVALQVYWPAFTLNTDASVSLLIVWSPCSSCVSVICTPLVVDSICIPLKYHVTLGAGKAVTVAVNVTGLYSATDGADATKSIFGRSVIVHNKLIWSHVAVFMTYIVQSQWRYCCHCHTDWHRHRSRRRRQWLLCCWWWCF